MSPEWLTRDGHLTTLSLERHLAGEIDASPHLESCEACMVRHMALLEDAITMPPAPPIAPAKAPSPWPLAGVILAAAAALVFLVILPTAPSNDGVRVKGSFAFEVHAHDGKTSRLLVDGDAVAAGERLGFRVKSDAAGHLLILGRDAADTIWLAYPQDGQGQSAPFEAGALRDLKQAVTLDATPGEERLIAVLCADPITQASAGPLVLKRATPEGCRVRQITLRKTAAAP